MMTQTSHHCASGDCTVDQVRTAAKHSTPRHAAKHTGRAARGAADAEPRGFRET